jgi:hypothetical protein
MKKFTSIHHKVLKYLMAREVNCGGLDGACMALGRLPGSGMSESMDFLCPWVSGGLNLTMACM